MIDMPTKVRDWPQRGNYVASLAEPPRHQKERDSLEEHLLLSLARETHRMGGQWAGWPTFTLHVPDSEFAWEPYRLEAHVWIIPRPETRS